MTIWFILRALEIFYGLLVHFVVIWYIFPRFGILDQEKSGNPVPETKGSFAIGFISSIAFFRCNRVHSIKNNEMNPMYPFLSLWLREKVQTSFL
jgi:hypothetical protein